MIPLWAISLCGVVSTFFSSYWRTAPRQQIARPLPQKLIQRLNEDAPNTDSKLDATCHFLCSDIQGSLNVIDHLLSRQPIEEANEQVILVGNDPELESRILCGGYRLVVVSEPELKDRYDVDSTPTMVISNRKGAILYSGGYESQEQNCNFHDVSIIKKVIDSAQ